MNERIFMTEEELLGIIIRCYDRDKAEDVFFHEDDERGVLENWYITSRELSEVKENDEPHHSYIIKRMLRDGIIVPCVFHYYYDDDGELEAMVRCKSRKWYSLTTETVEYIRMMREI